MIPYRSTLQALNWDLRTHLEVQPSSKLLNEPHTLPLFCPLALCLMFFVLQCHQGNWHKMKDVKFSDFVKRPPKSGCQTKEKQWPDARIITQASRVNISPDNSFHALRLLMDVKIFIMPQGHQLSTKVHFTLGPSQMAFPCAGGTCFGERGVTLTETVPSKNRSCWYSHLSQLDNTLRTSSSSWDCTGDQLCTWPTETTE